jgi:hypothetical protein
VPWTEIVRKQLRSNTILKTAENKENINVFMIEKGENFDQASLDDW